jgi:hypothetical protein
MTDDQSLTSIAPARVSRMVTAAEFQKLADVPPEVEWFANLTNVHTLTYENAVKDFMRFGAHALRATAATNALDHQADIAKVQEWLGHANIATTRIYDHRTRPKDSPTFKVAY